MARPLKSDEQRRMFAIPPIRVNASEKSLIEHNAKLAGQEVSVFLRGLGTGHRPTRNVPTPDREILLKLLAELNKNGSNLNQIARAYNRRQDSEELIGIDTQLLETALYGVDALSRAIMQILSL